MKQWSAGELDGPEEPRDGKTVESPGGTRVKEMTRCSREGGS